MSTIWGEILVYNVPRSIANRSFIRLSSPLHINIPLNMTDYSFDYFTVRFPINHEYVAHVEINRPERLNAFIEV